MYTCRECEHVINQATEICPHCGADLTLPAAGEAEAPTRKLSLAQALLRWGVVVGALAGLLWGFLWYILPERSGDPAARAEARAVEALRDLRAALAAYAQSQPAAAGYPATLEALGDRARGPAQSALSQGYQVQYVPGMPGSDGIVRNYVLLARPGNYSYRNYYVDETGVLRATRENRPATAQDPPI
jgi:hypothetical protein